MSDRTTSWEEAASLVEDGLTIGFGGSVLRRKPIAAARAIVSAGRRDLDVVTFAGSLEIELLLAAGALRSVRSSYVGLGEHGRCPGFSDAVRAGRIVDEEMSEWMLVGGLRAASMGVPFLPTRAALGSQLVSERDLRFVADPYSGEELIAVPRLRPDVSFIHAWRADEAGNTQFPWPPDYLSDVDVLLARASKRVVVSVEQIVGSSTIQRNDELTRLFGFEVTRVVESPSGAWPTALPPEYEEDHDWLQANLDRPGEILLQNSSAIDHRDGG